MSHLALKVGHSFDEFSLRKPHLFHIATSISELTTGTMATHAVGQKIEATGQTQKERPILPAEIWSMVPENFRCDKSIENSCKLWPNVRLVCHLFKTDIERKFIDTVSDGAQALTDDEWDCDQCDYRLSDSPHETCYHHYFQKQNLHNDRLFCLPPFSLTSDYVT